MNILQALSDPNLFGPFFQASSWHPWQALLAAMFGLPMDAEGRAIFRRCTGLTRPYRQPIKESWLIVGRRGGKSRIAALVAAYLACFFDYSKRLAPGEQGMVMLIATNRDQARVLMGYVRQFINEIPLLKAMVVKENRESIELANNIIIGIQTCSYRTVRGYTIVAVICDEIAFWRSEDSANPDHEILQAIRPGMLTIPNAMLVCISSPYARRGALWDAYRRYYGKPSPDVLVWQADTRTMNPAVPKREIERAYERDPEWAKAEYGAEFRSDIEAFITREAVEARIRPGLFELPPISGPRYRAFVDPAGGSGGDSMTLAIAHEERGAQVLDCLREARPPFSPDAVVENFSQVLKQYRINRVRGDRYAGEWPRERFLVQGVRYEVCTKVKSDIYRDFLPLLNSGRVDLLDNARLIFQLTSLERRTGRGGRDSIDHAPGGHDDVANAAAGALVLPLQLKRAGLW